MPTTADISVEGTLELAATMTAIRSGPFQNRLLSPALGKMASHVRRQASRRGFGFIDRNGPRIGGAKYRSLRSSIRRVPRRARYAGRRYGRGAYQVVAGGDGARQAYLVEHGHGGPRPARPHSFLRAALIRTRHQLNIIFASDIRTRLPSLVRRYSVQSNSRGVRRRGILR